MCGLRFRSARSVLHFAFALISAFGVNIAIGLSSLCSVTIPCLYFLFPVPSMSPCESCLQISELLLMLCMFVRCSILGLSHLGHAIVPNSGYDLSPSSLSISDLCSSSIWKMMLALFCFPELIKALHIVLPISMGSEFLSHLSLNSGMGPSKNPVVCLLVSGVVEGLLRMMGLGIVLCG